MQRVAVIGGGTMGVGIAEARARSGSDVVVVEAESARAERCRARIEASLQRAARADRLTTAEAGSALGRLEVTTDLDGAATAELAIEAVPEAESIKLDLFRRLDAI